MAGVNRFKAAAKDVGAKQTFSKFILANSDQSIAVDKIVAVASKYKIILSKNLDDYERGKNSTRLGYMERTCTN